MIEYITGNWLRNWSPNIEAGERVCRVERLLSDRRYIMRQSSPIHLSTDRIITDDEILQATDEKNLHDRVAEKIKSQSSDCVGNLHGLIWNMRNLKPQHKRYVYFNHSFQDFYYPGEISVSYVIDKASGKPFNYVELCVKTIQPRGAPSFDYVSYSGEKQLLFDWGNTNKLVVDFRTGDDMFGKEIREVARKVRHQHETP